MTPRQSRALRGTAAASVATFAAATAHTLAGDGAPPPLLLAVVGVLASPLAVAMAGRRPSPWRIGLTVLASQALFHVAFAISGGAGSGALPAGHAHHGVMIAPTWARSPDVALGLLPDAPMLLGHLIAAVATTFALLYGERMLAALGRGIRRLLVPGGRLVAPPAPFRVPHTPGRNRTSRPQSVPLSALSRRGPPAFVIAAF